MKTNKELRLENLLQLIDAHKTKAAFAKRIGKSVQQLNSLLSGKGIGDSLARTIESKCKKPKGWLDHEHTHKISETNEHGESIPVNRLSADMSMGTGLVVPDYEEVVDRLSVNKRWLYENFTITSPGNLRLATGYGDSMSPTISDGDVILVDTGVTEIKMDAVFVLVREDELFIKRIQRMLDGTYLVISDNKAAYDPYPLAAKDFKTIRVCGRALLVWNGRKL